MEENVNPIGVKCPVDWNRVPEWANWAVMQPDGDVICYSSKPVWDAKLNKWIYEHDKLISGNYSVVRPPDASACIWKRSE